MRRLALRACDCTFVVECNDVETVELVLAGFGGLLAPAPTEGADAAPYRVSRDPAGRGFRLLSPRGDAESFDDAAGLFFYLDKQLVVGLQLQRPDLYFLHAAAVAADGRVAVIAAPAGTGKSTLTLALLEDGFTYLSDELAPIDLRSGHVHPYPHALCLKAPTRRPYPVVHGTFAGRERFHVPVTALPTETAHDPLTLTALIFVQRTPNPEFLYRPIAAARATARLMQNSLNPLAHPGDGIDAAMQMTGLAACYELDSGDLPAACAAVRKILRGELPEERVGT